MTKFLDYTETARRQKKRESQPPNSWERRTQNRDGVVGGERRGPSSDTADDKISDSVSETVKAFPFSPADNF